MSSFNQGVPGPATLINSSNCIVYGNTTSGTALTVQQLGAGAVMNVATTTGSSALFVSSTGQVGVGTTGPNGTAHVWNVAATGGPKLSIGDNTAFAPGGLHSIAALTSTLGAGNGNSIILGRTNATNDAFQMTFMNVAQGSTTNYLGFNAFGSSYTAALAITAGGNVGIGTTSPSALLQIRGTTNIGGQQGTPSSNTIASFLNDLTYGTNEAVDIEIGSQSRQIGNFGSVYKYRVGTINSGTAYGGSNFYINAVPTAAGAYTSDGTALNRMTIRYDGNVGIGTTSPQRLLHVYTGVSGNAAAFVSGGGAGSYSNVDITSYLNASSVPTVRIATIDDGAYSGHFTILTKTPSGIENNVMNERMRITSGGNVGIGTTNPGTALGGALLDVYASGTGVSSNVNISAGCDGSASGSNKASLIFNIKGSGGGIVNGAITHQLLGSNYGFNFQPFTLGTSVMVIKGDGNVGIGTTNPGYTLTSAGTICGPYSTTPLLACYSQGSGTFTYANVISCAYINSRDSTQIFTPGNGGNGGAPVMTLQHGNLVGIGTTSPGYPLDVLSSSTALFRIQSSNDPATMVISTYSDTTKDCAIRNNNGQLGFTASSTPGTPYIKFFTGASGAFTNLLGGFSSTLTGGATTLSVDASGYIIRTPSDERLKTDVQPISYGLDTVNSFRPVSYNWNEPEKYGSGRSIGLIAQEVGELVPEAVSAGGDEDKILSLDYQKLVPVLTKAIQELSQENTALKQSLETATAQLQSIEQRLAALEGTIGSRVGA